jgi:hypothetical protein
MKLIPLSKDRQAIVDDRDHEWLKEFVWYADGRQKENRFWAVTNVTDPRTGKKRRVQMDRLIMRVPSGGSQDIDHKDGNGLNNTRDNLVIVPSRLAAPRISKARIDSRSGITGVHWSKRRENWNSQIQTNGKNRLILRSKSCETACRAYREAEVASRGESARDEESFLADLERAKRWDVTSKRPS